MLIDTHAHLNFNAFKADADLVIKRTLENDMWVINVGSQYSTSERAVEITKRYEKGIFAAVGLHPIHLEARKVDASEVDSQAIFETRAEEFDYENYKKLAQDPKVVAIGEIGLDYYYKPKTKRKLELFKEKQKETLFKQLELAKALDLPVIFHCRMAHDDLIQTIRQWNNQTLRAVIHCFTGNGEQAQKFLEFGFYLAFNGLIFKKVPALPDPKEIISAIPLDRILLETDSPYLLLPQARGERNEPLNVRFVAEKIAEIKGESYKKIAEFTTQNAKELFQI